MRNRWKLLGLLGISCLIAALGCTTTTPAPPPPGYCVPCCPPTSYQASQTCTPTPANTCNPCMQGWQAPAGQR